MKQWEFTNVFFEDGDVPIFAEKMQKLGNQGWQMVQAVETYTDGSGLSVLLQRPKQSDLMRFLRHMVEYYYENGGVNTQLMERLDAMIEDE